MKTKYILLPIVTLVLGLLVLVSVPLTYPVDQSESLQYRGMVCVYKNNELVECNHNILVTTGMTQIQDHLGIGATGAVKTIAVGNGTAAQVAGDTSLAGEIADVGLAKTTGTYVATGTAGAWNITYQWTCGAGCINEGVNNTGLYNATGAGQLFAETTFTNVVLQQNDKLNVTWGLTVT